MIVGSYLLLALGLCLCLILTLALGTLIGRWILLLWLGSLDSLVHDGRSDSFLDLLLVLNSDQDSLLEVSSFLNIRIKQSRSPDVPLKLLVDLMLGFVRKKLRKFCKKHTILEVMYFCLLGFLIPFLWSFLFWLWFVWFFDLAICPARFIDNKVDSSYPAVARPKV